MTAMWMAASASDIEVPWRGSDSQWFDADRARAAVRELVGKIMHMAPVLGALYHFRPGADYGTRVGRTPIPRDGAPPAPTPGPAPFSLGVTKPIATLHPTYTPGEYVAGANAGVGVARPYPTQVINGNHTMVGTNNLIDTVVLGRVSFAAGASGKISNCDIKGAGVLNYTGDMISTNGTTNVILIEFTTVREAAGTAFAHGIGQRNYTAYRCDVYDVVDCFSAAPASSGQQTKVIIEGCYGHHMLHKSPDPSKSDNRTHKDILQSHGGTGTRATGNNFAAHNCPTHSTADAGLTDKKLLACLMLNDNVGPSTGLIMDRNWLEGGEWPINAGDGSSTMSLTLTNNKFDRTSKTNQQINVNLRHGYVGTGNVFEDTGLPVNTVRWN